MYKRVSLPSKVLEKLWYAIMNFYESVMYVGTNINMLGRGRGNHFILSRIKEPTPEGQGVVFSFTGGRRPGFRPHQQVQG